MKQIFSAICLVALLTFFISCKKETNVTSSSIDGAWELQSMQTGMIPTINYLPGNGNILKFTNSNYQLFSNGQLVKNGNYSIVADGSAENETCLALPSDQFKNRIIYDNNNTGKIFLQITDNKITFLSGCFALDGGVFEKYVRQEK